MGKGAVRVRSGQIRIRNKFRGTTVSAFVNGFESNDQFCHSYLSGLVLFRHTFGSALISQHFCQERDNISIGISVH